MITEKPFKTKLIKTEIGIINPSKIGTVHIPIHVNFFKNETSSSSKLFCPLLFSWKRWFRLAKYSIVNKITTIIKSTDEICEAPERLFIPIQTLNTPSVKVSRAK